MPEKLLEKTSKIYVIFEVLSSLMFVKFPWLFFALVKRIY